MITKSFLEGRAKKKDAKGRRISRDGGGNPPRPQSWVYACNGDPRVCPMKAHPRIRCAVHGTALEAMKCIQKSIEAAKKTAAGGIE